MISGINSGKTTLLPSQHAKAPFRCTGKLAAARPNNDVARLK
jgi:hypothetical protein